jgi:dihydropyrimidine dehydrogenase (NAD+) subunit PreA
MRNPIGVAPLNPAVAYARKPEVQADWLMRHAEAGAGYLYISATRLQRTHPSEAYPSQKFLKIQTPGFAAKEGISCIGDIMAVQLYLDKTLETMALIKKQLPYDVPIIAQPHVGEPDLDQWVELCQTLEQAGASALELNICPISLVSQGEIGSKTMMDQIDTLEMRTLRQLGLAPGMSEVPEIVQVIVKACTEAVKIPVGIKPSAEVGYPKCVALARVAADSGAKWVSNITGSISIAPPDIYNKGRSPWEKLFLPINPPGAISGSTDRYHCRKDTVNIAMFVPDIDIMAIGGIVNPEHAVEMLMLGAKAIGLSSGFLWKGRKLITDTVNFLNNLMDEQGYPGMEDLVGAGLKYVKPLDSKTDWKVGQITARVDEKKCIRCGVCTDAFCPVPVKGADGYPVISEDLCQACGMCVAICPADAINVIQR